MTTGVCALTGSPGKFVACHLIPKALTRPGRKGSYFITFGRGTSPKRSWTSWYDLSLVTEEGEKILSQYDDWAIKELRRLKLIWQSWGPITSFYKPTIEWPGASSFDIRKVVCRDPKRLRLFYLSLLWRSAATNHEGFEQVELSARDLKKLRAMIVEGNPLPLDFYPTTLLQIATLGPIHNQTPSLCDSLIELDKYKVVRHNVFRFYFDGLISNMHREKKDIDSIGQFVVGFSNDLYVQMQEFDDSLQHLELVGALLSNELK